MHITSSNITNEIANEILHFFLLFSYRAKLEGKREHHLTAGHLTILIAIPESFGKGAHLVTEFTVSRIYRTIRELGYKDKFPMVKKNLNELVKLEYLNREDNRYSYNFDFINQKKD